MEEDFLLDKTIKRSQMTSSGKNKDTFLLITYYYFGL